MSVQWCCFDVSRCQNSVSLSSIPKKIHALILMVELNVWQSCVCTRFLYVSCTCGTWFKKYSLRERPCRSCERRTVEEVGDDDGEGGERGDGVGGGIRDGGGQRRCGGGVTKNARDSASSNSHWYERLWQTEQTLRLASRRPVRDQSVRNSQQ